MNLPDLLKIKNIEHGMSGDNHVILDCEKCGRERKLYFNFLKGVGDCKVCGFIYNFKDIYDRYKLNPLMLPSKTLEEIKSKRVKQVEFSFEKLPLITLPEGTIDTLPFKAVLFLQRRGVFNKKSRMFKYCPHGFYGDRIIIPITDEEKRLVGFQARTLNKWDKKKYLFNKGCPKSRVWFNHESLESGEPIVIVENAFNAVYLNGVTPFSKTISDYQIQLLKKLAKTDKVILMLDYDALVDGYALSTKNRLSKYFHVEIFKLTKEAPQPDLVKPVILNKKLEEMKYRMQK